MKMLTSYQELDALGEGLARDFLNKMHETDAFSIDIDSFVKDYLNVPVKYESFAEKDKGKIGLLANGKTGNFVYINNEVKKVVFPKNTIVIEKFLLEPSENARRRFTLAHEAAHKILKNHIPITNETFFHNEFDREVNYTNDDLKKMLSLTESFANRLGAAILMPEFLLKKELDRYNKGKMLRCYDGGVFSPEEKIKLHNMSIDLGVFYSTLINRLKDIKMFEMHPIEEYISGILKIGGALL